ncbi:MAG: hypothetical protein ACSLFI_10595 [Solirubrobacterales bacterium]
MATRTFQRALLVFAASLTLLFAAQMSFASDSDARRVVLGAHKFMGPYGKGWGAAHPKTIYNGGVSSGLVRSISWKNWGGTVAVGRGKGSQYKPGGGYYAHRVVVKFRAYNKGRCRKHGPIAYRVLEANFQKYPGGPFGDWFLWSGSWSICG